MLLHSLLVQCHYKTTPKNNQLFLGHNCVPQWDRTIAVKVVITTQLFSHQHYSWYSWLCLSSSCLQWSSQTLSAHVQCSFLFLWGWPGHLHPCDDDFFLQRFRCLARASSLQPLSLQHHHLALSPLCRDLKVCAVPSFIVLDIIPLSISGVQHPASPSSSFHSLTRTQAPAQSPLQVRYCNTSTSHASLWQHALLSLC